MMKTVELILSFQHEELAYNNVTTRFGRQLYVMEQFLPHYLKAVPEGYDEDHASRGICTESMTL